MTPAAARLAPRGSPVALRPRLAAGMPLCTEALAVHYIPTYRYAQASL